MSFALIVTYIFGNEYFFFVMRTGEVELVSIIMGPCPGPLLGLLDSVLLLPLMCAHSTALDGTPGASVGGRGPNSKAEGAARQLGLLTPAAQIGSGPRRGVPYFC